MPASPDERRKHIDDGQTIKLAHPDGCEIEIKLPAPALLVATVIGELAEKGYLLSWPDLWYTVDTRTQSAPAPLERPGA